MSNRRNVFRSLLKMRPILLTLPRQYVSEMELRGSGNGTAVFFGAIALPGISLARACLFDIAIPSQLLLIRIRLTHEASTLINQKRVQNEGNGCQMVTKRDRPDGFSLLLLLKNKNLCQQMLPGANGCQFVLVRATLTMFIG